MKNVVTSSSGQKNKDYLQNRNTVTSQKHKSRVATSSACIHVELVFSSLNASICKLTSRTAGNVVPLNGYLKKNLS